MKNKTWKKWTEDEIELLKIHWKSSTMEELLKQFPSRGYNSLMLKAQQLGIKSETNRARRGSLEYLDRLHPKSCYWWGFIVADGHISNRGELAITLSKIDKDHLLKLANKLNCKIIERNNFVYLRLGDKKFGNKWLKILSINAPKTYFPPNLNIFITKENLLPFIIGMIDGDGCIWKSKNWVNLRIELHYNWFDTLQLISNNLKNYYNINCKVKYTKKGTSKLEITTKKDLKTLKNYITNVEFLERKWSKLDTL